MLDGCVPWPPELAERYREQGLWTGERLGDLLRRHGDRVALVDGPHRWTYAELDARADRLAAGLADLGIRPGDRVLVQLPNSAALVYVSVALFRLGAPPVYALPAHRSAEITHLAEATGAVAYIAPDRIGPFDCRALSLAGPHWTVIDGDPGPHLSLADITAAPRPLPPPDPGGVAFFLLSGGTTGLPKLIPRTHDDYALQLRSAAASMGVDEHSVYLAALPAAHNAALGCPGVLGTLRAGGKVVLARTPSPDEVFPLLTEEGVTITTLMPPLLSAWTEVAPLLGVDLTGLVVEVGGAVLQPEAARRAQDAGIRLSHWFGMAEGVHWHTRLDDPPELAATTQGRPLIPTDDYRIIDENGDEVPPGSPGEFLVSGPCTLRGYYDSPTYNESAFTPDGYLRTGDLVRLDPHGNLVVTGRVKDVINRGGEKIGPAELEGHIETHPDIRTAAVIGLPDSSLGEKICAAIVPEPGSTPTLAALRTYLTARGVATYKLPDHLRIVDTLALTATGKIDKRTLRATLTTESTR
ncbi:(2,3-dihydroxybenzoyl)adenylate synthase [Actinokineospora enzanensis]|uniref:(2,3-dihydroxybenzoyl)adenylate synthase n=1 Tax=Actinokineospora enzanensis TaxID=155975 RepID=UPI0003620922|nr:AMP-binding protein [Actinokineospora enzanensis]